MWIWLICSFVSLYVLVVLTLFLIYLNFLFAWRKNGTPMFTETSNDRFRSYHYLLICIYIYCSYSFVVSRNWCWRCLKIQKRKTLARHLPLLFIFSFSFYFFHPHAPLRHGNNCLFCPRLSTISPSLNISLNQ